MLPKGRICRTFWARDFGENFAASQRNKLAVPAALCPYMRQSYKIGSTGT